MCFKNGEPAKPFDDVGVWSFDPSSGRLVLKGGREAPIFFSVLDSKTLEKLDLDGQKIDSDLNYKLEDSRTAHTIEPRLFMHGMYQYMADAALFRECLTGLRLPVVFEGDHASLEAAYLRSNVQPGEPLKVHIEGSIVQRPPMEGVGTRAHLLVEHFIKLTPAVDCDNGFGTASLTNTFWRLKTLKGVFIGRDTPMNRDAHLVFHTERNGVLRLAGSTGCNSLSGSYELDGEAIFLAQDPMAMTMMACPPGNLEMEFVEMLKEVRRWEISGEHLVLYGEENAEVVGRFEAVYFQ